MEDVDGNEYVDYVGSWGPLILGHAHPAVVSAITATVGGGTSYGAPTEAESELAELVKSAFPSVDLLRLVSSGTEATMSALRVARAATGRSKVVKFEGCYHGHADAFLVKAGSGAATLGIPTSPGIPREISRQTLVLPYNDEDSLVGLLGKKWREIAAVIVEPVAANMGVVPPAPGYLEAMRRETKRHGIALIFDEVITGFRLAFGGAQAIFGIEPDLTAFGKIIGGGLPVGAYGGRRDYMKLVAPSGDVYQAGTLSGNPLAVAAGIAQLRYLKARPGVYGELEERAAALEDGLRSAARSAKIPVCINRVGSMMTPFFQAGPVTDWATADRSDRKKYGKFFNAMLDRGFYLPPSQFEALFVGTAHTAADVAMTVHAATASLRR